MKVNSSGEKPVTAGSGWETTPKRDMSSNGETPRMLNFSSVSAGGEPKLEADDSALEEA